MERRRGVNGGSIAWLRGFMLGRGGGRSQGERGVSVSRAERRRRLAISKAKGFQEPKINVNLRPPGRVNRAIMELYTPTHTHTHLQTAGTHNKHTYTYTYCPGIIYTEGECFIFCSHCCRQSEREGWATEGQEREIKKIQKQTVGEEQKRKIKKESKEGRQGMREYLCCSLQHSFCPGGSWETQHTSCWHVWKNIDDKRTEWV